MRKQTPGTFTFEDCVSLRETEKALLVDISGIGETWVPKSQIHADSEVYEPNQEGALVVMEWFADRLGAL